MPNHDFCIEHQDYTITVGLSMQFTDLDGSPRDVYLITNACTGIVEYESQTFDKAVGAIKHLSSKWADRDRDLSSLDLQSTKIAH